MSEADAGVSERLATHGKVSYLQIPASDVRRSAAFFAQVFGWKTRDDGNAAHLSFEDASGDLIGAFTTERTASPEPGLLPYIYVTAVDDALAAITAAGGMIATPARAEGALRVATFRDPAGNVIGLWQAG